MQRTIHLIRIIVLFVLENETSMLLGGIVDFRLRKQKVGDYSIDPGKL